MNKHLHGVTTTAWLKRAGVGTRAIASRVRTGDLRRVHRRVYVHGAAADTEHQRAAIALLVNKSRGVLTGAVAVRLHGVPERTRQTIDLVIPEGSYAAEPDGVQCRHSSHLDKIEVVERERLPVASLPWAIADLARDVDDRTLAWVASKAIGMRMLTVEGLEGALKQRPLFPGSARLRRVVGQLQSDIAFSGTELRACRTLRAAGFPAELNVPIRGSDGITRIRDLVVVERRANLELDGPHHWLPDQARRDREDDRQMRKDRWAVDRAAVYEVDEDPEMVIPLMRALMAG